MRKHIYESLNVPPEFLRDYLLLDDYNKNVVDSYLEHNESFIKIYSVQDIINLEHQRLSIIIENCEDHDWRQTFINNKKLLIPSTNISNSDE